MAFLSSADEAAPVAATTEQTVYRAQRMSGWALFVAFILLATFGLLLVFGIFQGTTSTTTPTVTTQTALVPDTTASVSGTYTTTETLDHSATTSTSVLTGTTVKGSTQASDALLEALLGAGGALLVFAVAYGRITSITLPGGAVVSLTADEDADAAAEGLKHSKDSADPAANRASVEKAKTAVRQAKRQQMGAVSLSSDEIARVVDQAFSN